MRIKQAKYLAIGMARPWKENFLPTRTVSKCVQAVPLDYRASAVRALSYCGNLFLDAKIGIPVELAARFSD
jgi:hypothetical protein